MRPPEPRLPYYLVEWYVGDLTEDAFRDTSVALDTVVAAMAAEGLPIRLVEVIAVPEDEFVFGLFAASAALLVEQACERVARPPIRITAALRNRPTVRECAHARQM